ncbi:MAG: alcohol dehydrogenase catalytic domain-containing protein [Candidatus Krumholzibacteria bacterium]|nr:alcohol dehydrogenase catalytic domain-containing protein [Candidatus Krumholzibacteria bacterium]
MAATMMKSLVYDKSSMPWDKTRGLLALDRPTPTLNSEGDGENVLIKVIYAGFCGSDRGIWNRTAFKGMIFDSLKQQKATTRIIGHEMVGEIVGVGRKVSARYGFNVKDIVSTESHIICGGCYQCRIGQTHICSQDTIIGIGRDGCFAEYIKLPANVLWATDPRRIRMKVAALQEPFGNAVHACTTADLRGKSVAVFGCGTIGLFVIMVARALGATRVIGIEPNDRNRAMASQLGADEVIPVDLSRSAPGSWGADKQLVKDVRNAFDGIGADVSMEMAGFNTSVNNAIQSTRRGGDVILFGLKHGNVNIQAFDRLIVNGLSLHSVIGRRIFETWYITRNLLEDRTNGIQDKISDVILGGGNDAVVHINDFAPESFEQTLAQWPKPLIQF